MEDGITGAPCAPEKAITECLSMIDLLEPCLKNTNFSGDLRQEVWEREIQDLRSQSAPNTLITVCGATGVGKSSLLNAVLNDVIVPTSSMHACTSVVTEISYHDKPTIDADVSFLSKDDWRSELTVLLQDLHDEGKNIKRAIESRSHAKVAWQKVHAVYPVLLPNDLAKMKVDDIIALDPDIAKLLGITHHIQSEDSMIFGQEIGKYVNATERSLQKGGKNDKKEGDKETEGDPNEGPLEPALWPLIRQVTIRCRAEALSTGAILVDLPGVADTNAARNQIAKNYLKKSHRIWILAPITRAVDDKVAKDLLGDAFKYQIMSKRAFHTYCAMLMNRSGYDPNRITFIATKTDDLSCADVIKGLQLQQHPELRSIEDELKTYRQQVASWEKERKRIRAEIKAISSELKDAHSGENKRKRKSGKGSPAKRIHLEEDELESSPLKEVDENSEDDDSDMSADAMILALLDDVAAHRLKSLPSLKAQAKEATDTVAKAKKDQAVVQKKKNAFCSLKRSEFTRNALKDDFRRGLRELDEQIAEEEDPDNFDPDADVRDYECIDLPVFTCSSRDYLRLKGYAKGDGDPVCFSDPEDTGIPDLQSWCHQLTSNSRQRCAISLLRQLKAISATIKSHVGSRYNISPAERALLQQKWQTPVPRQTTTSAKRFKHSPDSDGDLDNLLHDRGIMPRLKQELDATIDESVQRYFKSSFQQGLEFQCKIGAKDASQVAVDAHDAFAASMHWSSYRAVLRRYGKWNRNLNVELTLPFMRAIAKAWVDIFLSNLWQPFMNAANKVIEILLQDMENSATTENLKNAVKMQADVCLKEWTVAVKKIVDVAEERLKEKQKEISRFFEDHVSDNLTEGYKTAAEQRGAGSVKRQKETMRQHISDRRDEMFEHGADTIMKLLDMAADAVTEMLKTEISDLPKKVEANMSVLWEVKDETPEQIVASKILLETVELVLGKVGPMIDHGISDSTMLE